MADRDTEAVAAPAEAERDCELVPWVKDKELAVRVTSLVAEREGLNVYEDDHDMLKVPASVTEPTEALSVGVGVGGGVIVAVFEADAPSDRDPSVAECDVEALCD